MRDFFDRRCTAALCGYFRPVSGTHVYGSEKEADLFAEGDMVRWEDGKEKDDTQAIYPDHYGDGRNLGPFADLPEHHCGIKS